jgi:PAS domain S-box-containing protein
MRVPGLPGLFRRSLRTRLVASFLALSAVTVVVVGVTAYGRATADLTASVFDRLDAVSGIKADALDRWLDEQTRNVVFMSVLPGVGDDARTVLDPGSATDTRSSATDRLRALLATVVAQTADAEEIDILDLSGTVRVSTLPSHEGASVAAEPFFLTGSAHTFVQNAYRSIADGRRTITVATPLFDKDGKGRRVAVVAANLSLERVDRIIQERTGLGSSGRAILIGPDGERIQATSASTDAPVTTVAAQAIATQQSGRSLYADERGQPVIGVYTWLPDRNAGLITEMSQDEAFAPARQLALVIGVIGLASTLVLGGGIWLVARRVTRPILSLAATATKVRNGDLQAESGIRADDEVGVLAGAFDDMTAKLRENVETLERRVEDRTAELRRQKTYFEALVEVSPVAIVTMDLEERVSAWNPAATTLFGYEPGEAIGRSIDDLVLRSEARIEEGHSLMRRALDDGRADLISQRLRKDGTALDVEISMVPLVVDGAHLGFYAIYHDITELEAARRDADSANQAKSAFLAAMSHEIRTPMNGVIGMTGLLLETKLDADQRDFAESISISGEALLTIINDILDFSKIEAGRFELESIPFDLPRTVRLASELIRPNAAKKGIELAVTFEGDEPPMLLGDPGRIRQIVLNLLSNAVKFTDAGTVGLTVRAEREDAEGPWQVRLAVQDQGIGIPPEAMGRLFQSFSQADASTARRYGGTGLGLAISRRLAELMGGTLAATSDGVPGKGSRFELAFTTVAAPDEAAAGVTGGGPGGEASRTVGAGPALRDRGLRVLLAEDQPMNQKLALRLLSNAGVEADVAKDGNEVLEALARTPYDVILMDVQMPELDGLEATRRIRAEAAGPQPWIIAMTGNAMEGDREECLAAGMNDYLSKPIRPAELTAALEAAPGPHATPGPALAGTQGVP